MINPRFSGNSQGLQLESRKSSDEEQQNNQELVQNQQNQSSASSTDSEAQIMHEASSSSSEEEEESYEDVLIMNLLQQAISSEKKMAYKQNLCEEELRKYHDESLLIKEQEASGKEDQLQLVRSIHELFLVKLLVNIYDKSNFRMVKAHYQLGKSYIKNQCYDMAIEHISIALFKNQQLFNQNIHFRQLHPYIINAKAEALMKTKNYQEAINILKNNLIDDKVNIPYSQSWNKTTILLAQSYSALNKFEEALKTINLVVNYSKKNNKSLHHKAFSLVEKANILGRSGKFLQAIQSQEMAIKIMIQMNYGKPEFVVSMYEKVAKYYGEALQPQNALLAMQKVRTLYQELYNQDDKQVIKARRKIAVLLLKNQRYKEAVNQLIEIVEIEERVLGQNSLATARTLKLLGIIYRTLDTNNAKVYLNKALKIFQKYGVTKQISDIKLKIITINSVHNGRTMDIFPHSQQQI